MGADLQKESQAFLECDIPTSLRPVYPFLNDAQRNLSNSQKATSPKEAVCRKRIAAASITHAFKVIDVFHF